MARLKRSNEGMEMGYYEAASLFIQEKEAMNLVHSTIHNYERTIGGFGEYFEFTDETAINEVTLQKIYQFINHLKKQDLSAYSVRHYITQMKVFLYWCMERKYIEPYKIPLPKAQEEQPKFYNDDEIAALLEKPKRGAGFVEWRNWTMTAWILATGNRASTVCDVKLKDIDYGRKEIILHHTKNKRAQIVPLSSALESAIKEYIRIWRKGADKEAYLFPTQDDFKNNATNTSKSFRLYCDARGVKHKGVHGLRHTFARLWVKNGGNTFQLQKILGHSTLQMTERYVKLFGDDLKEGFDDYSPLDTIRRKTARTKTIK